MSLSPSSWDLKDEASCRKACRKCKSLSRWWQLNTLFQTSPLLTWGFMIQFEEHIFEMAWFNHPFCLLECLFIYHKVLASASPMRPMGIFTDRNPPQKTHQKNWTVWTWSWTILEGLCICAIYSDQTAKVTPNGGLVRESYPNGLKFRLRIYNKLMYAFIFFSPKIKHSETVVQYANSRNNLWKFVDWKQQRIS